MAQHQRQQTLELEQSGTGVVAIMVVPGGNGHTGSMAHPGNGGNGKHWRIWKCINYHINLWVGFSTVVGSGVGGAGGGGSNNRGGGAAVEVVKPQQHKSVHVQLTQPVVVRAGTCPSHFGQRRCWRSRTDSLRVSQH